MSEMTKLQFAKRAKVAASRVSKWIEEGLPVTKRGKISVAAADKWLRENLDHARRQKGADPKLAELRRAREGVKLESDKIALAKESGELIERALVRRWAEARGRLDRDAHMAGYREPRRSWPAYSVSMRRGSMPGSTRSCVIIYASLLRRRCQRARVWHEFSVDR